MNKKEIIKRFHRLPGADAKESFLRENDVKFTHDSFDNIIIWADDGTLQLFPVRR